MRSYYLQLLLVSSAPAFGFTTGSAKLHQKRDVADSSIVLSRRAKFEYVTPAKKLSAHQSGPGSLSTKKIISNTAFLLFLKFCLQRYVSPLLPMSPTWERPSGVLTKTIILPLLSSSCCSIQLMINAITALGCAGFNTFLGPLRPYFMSVLLLSSISSIAARKGDFLSLCTRIFFSWLVALTPEIVHILKENRRRKNMNEALAMNTGALHHKLELQISDMGCVACIEKIESELWTSFSDKIVDAEACLHNDRKGGEARVIIKLSSEVEIEDTVQAMIRKIKGIGFNCELKDTFEVD